MTDKTWKAVERAYAKLFGAKRVPITGRTRGDEPDLAHPWMSLEIKHRKELPLWMHDAVNQAEMSKRGKQLPITVLHQKNQRYRDGFVLLRVGDFLDWFGN